MKWSSPSGIARPLATTDAVYVSNSTVLPKQACAVGRLRFMRVVFVCGLFAFSFQAIPSAVAQETVTTLRATQAGRSDPIAHAPRVILEVTSTYFSFWHSRNPYVYLRVFSDGATEWQSSGGDNPSQKTLSQDEFAQLKSVLRDPKLAKLSPRYESRYPVLDSSTEWRIEIQRPGQPQVIEVVEFAPLLGRRVKHPYPDALVKLGCSIEKSRADVSGESISLDRECQRVLGTSNRPD